MMRLPRKGYPLGAFDTSTKKKKKKGATVSSLYTKTASTSNPSPKLHSSKLDFRELEDSKKSVSEIFAVSDRKIGVLNGARRFEVKARTAASKTIEVEVDKPLGLTLGQKQGGGVVITGVEGGGNAAKAGLKSGDQVLYTSSFFGDELWPADKLGFTKTAIRAKPDSVYFVVSRCVCVCVLASPDVPETYVCPQCIAPKKRFARYDVNTGKAIGGGLPPIGVIVGLLARSWCCWSFACVRSPMTCL
ncbi:hypothetical protein YC2023_119612 [Brassica napus]